MKPLIASLAVAIACALSGGCVTKDPDLPLIAQTFQEKHPEYLDAIPWSFPAKPLGPYSKLGGLTAYFTNAPDGGRTYVFYLGKSRQTKEWEVFASMMYRDGKWEPVPVKLPQPTK
jgi:hypothetical protein